MRIKTLSIDSALASTEGRCPLRDIHPRRNRRIIKNSVFKLYLISFLEVFASYSWNGQ